MLEILWESLAQKESRLKAPGRARERYGAVESIRGDSAAPARIERLRIKDPVPTAHYGLGIWTECKADARLECLVVHRLRILLTEASGTPFVPGESQPAGPVTRAWIGSIIKERHVIALLGGGGGDIPAQPKV